MLRLKMLGIMLCLLVATSLYASSVGSVIVPLEQGKISVGAEYTRVFDRDLNAANTSVDNYNQAYANVAYGLIDNLKIYTKFGMADMNINGSAGDNLLTEEEYDFGFLWGFGVSGNYKLEDGWLIGAAGEYAAWKTDFDSVKLNGESGTNLKGDLENTEWQITLFGGKEVALNGSEIKFLPYAGLKYAGFEADYNDLEFTTSSGIFMGTGKVKNDNRFGIITGISANLNKSLTANIEGQFMDETGVNVSLSYKF